MECDICFEKFDHSLNKPVALIRCLHTICSACLKRLKEKKCPTCNRPIEDSETNWHLLKHVAESEYDKFKLEVIKYLSSQESKTTQSDEIKLKKKEKYNNLIKLLKSQLETFYNEAIKQMNQRKQTYFKDIEKLVKFLIKDTTEYKPNELVHRNEVILGVNEFKKQLLAEKETYSKKIVKFLKNKIENNYNEKIKPIIEFKKQLFNQIESFGKDLNKHFAESALIPNNLMIKQDEIRKRVNDNEFTKEDFSSLKQTYNDHSIQLDKFEDSFLDYDNQWVI